MLNVDLSPLNYADKQIAVMEELLELSCEVCDNEIDDDNDGYIDCYDLDCILQQNENFRNPDTNRENSDVCYVLSEACLASIQGFIADINRDEWLQSNLEVLEWGLSFMSEYGCSEEIGNYVVSAFNLKKADNEINLSRVEDLYVFLLNNPEGLITGCPDFDLSTHSDLLNLEVPSAIVEQLESYGLCLDNQPIPPNYYSTSSPCFSLQTIEDGTSSLVNVDYYAVEIDTMPDFNSDGVPDSPSELYQVFRDSFTNLASGTTFISRDSTFCLAPFDINASWEFEPYDPAVDVPIWQSQTIGARFFINSDANHVNSIVVDDGAIITIQENSDNFVIHTIKTPRSNSQPFSGKRMWGIRLNQNNRYEIFTRAADTAKPLGVIPILGVEVIYPECDDKDYFEIAYRTWSNMQYKVNNFINNNGGNSSIKEPSIVHMSFEVFYNKLKSNTPVNFISCY